MGRGDKKKKKGKIWRGSHGKTRPKRGKKILIKRVATTETEAES